MSERIEHAREGLEHAHHHAEHGGEHKAAGGARGVAILIAALFFVAGRDTTSVPHVGN